MVSMHIFLMELQSVVEPVSQDAKQEVAMGLIKGGRNGGLDMEGRSLNSHFSKVYMKSGFKTSVLE